MKTTLKEIVDQKIDIGENQNINTNPSDHDEYELLVNENEDVTEMLTISSVANFARSSFKSSSMRSFNVRVY